MWGKALSRLCRLLVIVAYTAATITAAASPFAACPTLDLDHPSQAEHTHGATHHEHRCIGACLLGASLLPPASDTASSASYGSRIVYLREEIVLADRSIPPDPAPPKPIT